MAKTTATKYLSNVVKSVKYATIDVMKEMNPVIVDTVETNADVAKTVYSSIRHMRRTTTKAYNTLMKSQVGEMAGALKKNIIADLKSGNFYNRERAESAIDSASDNFFDEDMGFGDDDSDLGFGDDIGAGDEMLADTIDEVGERSSNAIGQVLLRTAEYQVEATRQSTAKTLTQQVIMTNTLHSDLTAMNANLANMMNFNSQAVTTHMENSRLFYETQQKQMDEQTSILREMLELQKSIYMPKQKNASSKITASDIFTSSGAINLADYFKYVQQNIKEADTGVMDMVGLIKDMGMGESMMANPLSGVVQGMVKNFFPKVFKEAMHEFNESISGAIATGLLKLTNAKDSGSGILSKLGEILGLDLSVKKRINTANYNKDTVPWNGKDHRALTVVIPDLLGKIYSAVSGSPEMKYDYEAGKFKSLESIRKSFDREKERYVYSANDELIPEINKQLSRIKFNNDSDKESLIRSLEQLMKNNFDKMKYFNPNDKSKKAKDYGLKGDRAEYELAIIREMWKRIPEWKQLKANRDLIEAISSHNDWMKRIESDGDSVYHNLFSEEKEKDKNGKDIKKTVITPIGSRIDTANNFLEKIYDINSKLFDKINSIKFPIPVVYRTPNLRNNNTSEAGNKSSRDNQGKNTNTNNNPSQSDNTSEIRKSIQDRLARVRSNKREEKGRLSRLLTNRAKISDMRQRLKNEENLDEEQIQQRIQTYLEELRQKEAKEREKIKKEREKQEQERQKNLYRSTLGLRSEDRRSGSNNLLTDYSMVYDRVHGNFDNTIDWVDEPERGSSEYIQSIRDADTAVKKIKAFLKGTKNLVQQPLVFVGNVMRTVDKRMYSLLFGTGPNDKGSITSRIKEGFDDWFNNLKIRTKDKLDEIRESVGLGNKAKSALHALFGIDADAWLADFKDAMFGDKDTSFLSGMREIIGKGFHEIVDGVKGFFGKDGKGSSLKGIVKGKLTEEGKEKDKNNKRLTAQSSYIERERAKRAKEKARKRAEDNGEDFDETAYDNEHGTHILNAAKGMRRVAKTGIIAASAGEMIIPPDMNPYNISDRNRKEQTAISKFKSSGRGLGKVESFAAGGVVGEDNDGKTSKKVSEVVKDKALSYINIDKIIDLFRSGQYTQDQIVRIINYRSKKGDKDIAKRIASKLSDDELSNLGNAFEKFRKDNRSKIEDSDFEDGHKSLGRRVKDEGKDILNKIMKSDPVKSMTDRLWTVIDKGKANGARDVVNDTVVNLKDYVPRIAAGGVAGMGLSVMLGLVGGPLLGGAVGASLGLLSKSKKLQTWLFGNKITDEEGNVSRDGSGMISKDIVSKIDKYFPNMAKGGIIGSIASVLPFVPGGPIAGLLVGSAVGFARTNEDMRSALFGDGKTLENLTEKIQKMAPKMAIGSGAMFLAGPFGPVTNLLVGAGLGFVSDTEKFKSIVFGYEDVDGKRHGGLVGQAKDLLEIPLEGIKIQVKKTFNWLRDEMLKPVKTILKPLTQTIANMGNWMRDKIADSISTHIVKPIGERLKKYLIKPFQMLFRGLFAGVAGLTRKAISAPLKLVGLGADGPLRNRQLSKVGKASMTSLTNRIAERKARDQKAGNTKLQNSDAGLLDTYLAGASQEQIDALRRVQATIDPRTGKVITDAEKEKHFASQTGIDKLLLSEYRSGDFNTYIDKKGRKQEGDKGFKKVYDQALDAIKVGDYDAAANIIKGWKPVDQKQTDKIRKIVDRIYKAKEERNKLNDTWKNSEENLDKLRKETGINDIGSRAAKRTVEDAYRERFGSPNSVDEVDWSGNDDDTSKDVNDINDTTKSIDTNIKSITDLLTKIAFPESVQAKKLSDEFKANEDKKKAEEEEEKKKKAQETVAAKLQALEDKKKALEEKQKQIDEIREKAKAGEDDNVVPSFSDIKSAIESGDLSGAASLAKGVISKSKFGKLANKFSNTVKTAIKKPKSVMTDHGIIKMRTNAQGEEIPDDRDSETRDTLERRDEANQNSKGLLAKIGGLGSTIKGLFGFGDSDDDGSSKKGGILSTILGIGKGVLGGAGNLVSGLFGGGTVGTIVKTVLGAGLVAGLADKFLGNTGFGKKEKLDENGNVVRDENGNVVYEQQSLPEVISNAIRFALFGKEGNGGLIGFSKGFLFNYVLPGLKSGFEWLLGSGIPMFAEMLVANLPKLIWNGIKGIFSGAMSWVKSDSTSKIVDAVAGIESKKSSSELNSNIQTNLNIGGGSTTNSDVYMGEDITDNSPSSFNWGSTSLSYNGDTNTVSSSGGNSAIGSATQTIANNTATTNTASASGTTNAVSTNQSSVANAVANYTPISTDTTSNTGSGLLSNFTNNISGYAANQIQNNQVANNTATSMIANTSTPVYSDQVVSMDSDQIIDEILASKAYEKANSPQRQKVISQLVPLWNTMAGDTGYTYRELLNNDQITFGTATNSITGETEVLTGADIIHNSDLAAYFGLDTVVTDEERDANTLRSKRGVGDKVAGAVARIAISGGHGGKGLKAYSKASRALANATLGWMPIAGMGVRAGTKLEGAMHGSIDYIAKKARGENVKLIDNIKEFTNIGGSKKVNDGMKGPFKGVRRTYNKIKEAGGLINYATDNAKNIKGSVKDKVNNIKNNRAAKKTADAEYLANARDRIYGTGNSSLTNQITDQVSDQISDAAGDAASDSATRAINNAASDAAGDAAERSATRAINEAASDAAGDAAQSATQRIAEGAADGADKKDSIITRAINWVKEKLLAFFQDSKVVNKLKEVISKAQNGNKIAGQKLSDALIKFADKITAKFTSGIAGAGAKVLSKISEKIAIAAGTAGIGVVVMAVTDFLVGWKNADAIIGIYEPNYFMRFIAGVVNAISGNLLWGILDTETLVHLGISFFEILGFDMSEIRDQQQQVSEDCEAYNTENGTNYTPYEFLMKDKVESSSWFAPVDATKNLLGDTVGSVLGGAATGWETLKTDVTEGWNDIKEGSYVKGGLKIATSALHGAVDAVGATASNLVDGVVEFGGNFARLFTGESKVDRDKRLAEEAAEKEAREANRDMIKTVLESNPDLKTKFENEGIDIENNDTLDKYKVDENGNIVKKPSISEIFANTADMFSSGTAEQTATKTINETYNESDSVDHGGSGASFDDTESATDEPKSSIFSKMLGTFDSNAIQQLGTSTEENDDYASRLIDGDGNIIDDSNIETINEFGADINNGIPNYIQSLKNKIGGFFGLSGSELTGTHVGAKLYNTANNGPLAFINKMQTMWKNVSNKVNPLADSLPKTLESGMESVSRFLAVNFGFADPKDTNVNITEIADNTAYLNKRAEIIAQNSPLYNIFAGLSGSNSNDFKTQANATLTTSNKNRVSGTMKNMLSGVAKLFTGGSGSGIGNTEAKYKPVGDANPNIDNFVSQRYSNYSNQSFTATGDNARITVSDAGCAPAAATMAINNSIATPISMEEAMRHAIKYKKPHGGVTADYFVDEFANHGLKSAFVTEANKDKDDILKNQLRQGNSIVLMGRDIQNRSKTNSPFGPMDHYVVATGISEDGKTIYINDPEAKRPNIAYNAAKILKSSILGIVPMYSKKNKIQNNTLSRIKNILRNFSGRSVGDIIYVGDFRVRELQSDLGNIEGVTFIYTTLATVDWLKNNIGKVKDAVKSKPDAAVVMALGFKDLDHASDFVSYYGILSSVIGTSNIWYMSVNPSCDETNVSNTPIEAFNETLKGFAGYRYIDTYEYLKTNGFNKDSGHNYDTETNLKIHQFVVDTISKASETDTGVKSISDILSSLDELAVRYGLEALTNNSSSSDGDMDTGNSGDGSSTTNTGSISGNVSSNPQIAANQKAVVAKMASKMGQLIYSQNNADYPGPRNPDQGGADCSSTVNWAYKNVMNTDVGSYTGAQRKSPNTYTVATNLKDESKLQLGDLLLKQNPGHVEMYYGNGQMIGHGGPEKGPNIHQINPDGPYDLVRRLNAFKGSGSGIRFVSQYDSKFNNIKFGDSTVADAGCAPVVAAMTEDAYGMNPLSSAGTKEAIKRAIPYKMAGSGVTADYFLDEFNRSGYSSMLMQDQNMILNGLRNNRSIILLGQNSKNKSKNKSPFGPNSHYVLATGISKDGKTIYINDPEAKNGDVPYNVRDILGSVQLGIVPIKKGANKKIDSAISKVRNILKGINGRGQYGPDTVQYKVWHALRGAGYSEAAVAAVMGNIDRESGFDPSKVEAGSGRGFGLVQWTGSRRTDLENFAKEKGADPASLELQLEFLIQELSGTSAWSSKSSTAYDGVAYGKNDWEFSSDLYKSTVAFMAAYERPAVGGKQQIELRVSAAQQYYAAFKGSPIDTTVMSGTYSTTTTETTTQESDTSLTGLINTLEELGEAYGLVTPDTSSSTDGSTTTDTGSSSSEMGGSISSSKTSGTNYPKYDLDEKTFNHAANLVYGEAGSSGDIVAARQEASQIVNLNEKKGKSNTSSDLYATMTSKWYSSKSATHGTNEVSKQAVRDVMIGGKRTLPRYVTEHDLFPGDITNPKSRSDYRYGDEVRNRYMDSNDKPYKFFTFFGKDPLNGKGDISGWYDRDKNDTNKDDVIWEFEGSGSGMSKKTRKQVNLSGKGSSVSSSRISSTPAYNYSKTTNNTPSKGTTSIQVVEKSSSNIDKLLNVMITLLSQVVSNTTSIKDIAALVVKVVELQKSSNGSSESNTDMTKDLIKTKSLVLDAMRKSNMSSDQESVERLIRNVEAIAMQ